MLPGNTADTNHAVHCSSSVWAHPTAAPAGWAAARRPAPARRACRRPPMHPTPHPLPRCCSTPAFTIPHHLIIQSIGRQRGGRLMSRHFTEGRHILKRTPSSVAAVLNLKPTKCDIKQDSSSTPPPPCLICRYTSPTAHLLQRIGAALAYRHRQCIATLLTSLPVQLKDANLKHHEVVPTPARWPGPPSAAAQTSARACAATPSERPGRPSRPRAPRARPRAPRTWPPAGPATAHAPE